jgi:hypothetical protein
MMQEFKISLAGLTNNHAPSNEPKSGTLPGQVTFPGLRKVGAGSPISVVVSFAHGLPTADTGSSQLWRLAAFVRPARDAPRLDDGDQPRCFAAFPSEEALRLAIVDLHYPATIGPPNASISSR